MIAKIVILVNVNGYLSFRTAKSYGEPFTPFGPHFVGANYMLAPYWNDHDTSEQG